MYLELFFSFCRLLRVAVKLSAETVETTVTTACQQAIGEEYRNMAEENYLTICREVLQRPILEVGAQRERQHLLLGMRFLVCRTFKETTKDMLEHLIRVTGGTTLSRSSAELLLKKHSITPHCYIVVQDRTSLQKSMFGLSQVVTGSF